MAKKKETGSHLLAALGRTKKEQMKALTPPGLKKSKRSTSVKSKAPYVRGKVMGKGDSDKFLARRAVMGGVKASLPKPSIAASVSVPLGLVGAGVTGYQMGKKKGVKNVRAQEAKKSAEEGIKKQKEKKKERTMRGRRPKK
jgi:hypothetical protein